jgi:molybdate transport system permease protein
LVTHDPEEAAILADEILVLSNGRVLQSGRVAEVYRRPASAQVAALLGVRNLGQGVVAQDGTVVCGSMSLRVDVDAPAGTPVLWSVPPELVQVTELTDELGDRQSERSTGTRLAALVRDMIDLGTTVEITVQLEDGTELISRTPNPHVTTPGQRCVAELDREAVAAWAITPKPA